MGCCGGCGGEDKAKTNEQVKNEDDKAVKKQATEKAVTGSKSADKK